MNKTSAESEYKEESRKQGAVLNRRGTKALGTEWEGEGHTFSTDFDLQDSRTFSELTSHIGKIIPLCFYDASFLKQILSTGL